MNSAVTNIIKHDLFDVPAFHITRAEDLPYYNSPPIQFVYESTATLALGTYTWNDVPSPLTPNRPILDNALYFFRNISLTADIAEGDFTANIINSPLFYTFLDSDQRAVLFREPIVMNKFYDQFDYRFWWTRKRTNNQLFAAFVGIPITLAQGPNLLGKNTITLKAIISAQEVTDENFINKFIRHFPDGGKQ